MIVTAKKCVLATVLLAFSNAAGAMDNGTDSLTDKLHWAAAAGDLEEVKQVASEEYVDVNHQAAGNMTALHQAATSGNLQVAKWLVEEAGAKTDLGDESGCTPLHAAACSGNLEIVKWLVTEGHVDLDQPDHEGHTALYWAASALRWCGDRYGHAEMVRWLLDQGADPVALERLAGQLDKGRKDINRLLRERGRYVRDAKQTTRDVLIPQNGQWESLLPLLHKFLGWHVIDIQEKSGGKHDDETQEASEKL
ncbi:MAG: ankyrin repeat domain-containing protein, partial [Myxococcota bacterium]